MRNDLVSIPSVVHIFKEVFLSQLISRKHILGQMKYSQSPKNKQLCGSWRLSNYRKCSADMKFLSTSV